jgi:hypothetical protein
MTGITPQARKLARGVEGWRSAALVQQMSRDDEPVMVHGARMKELK